MKQLHYRCATSPWCPQRDSNSHTEVLASKTSVSTNSTTGACKNIFESTVMCFVGSFKFLPPDPQAFQSMMGCHKFSPYKGRCLDWRLSSLTVGMPFLLLTLSKMLSVYRGNYSTSRRPSSIDTHLNRPSHIPSTHSPCTELSCCQRWLGRPHG